jgi:hypothetical protein
VPGIGQYKAVGGPVRKAPAQNISKSIVVFNQMKQRSQILRPRYNLGAIGLSEENFEEQFNSLMLGPGKDEGLEQQIEDHLNSLKTTQEKDDYNKYILRVDKTADTSGFYLKSRPVPSDPEDSKEIIALRGILSNSIDETNFKKTAITKISNQNALL